MDPMETQRKKIQKIHDGVKKEAGNIEKILLSFHELLKKLSEGGKTGKTQKQMISILKGPFLSSTRKKLMLLQNSFDELDGNLRELFIFFNQFRRPSIAGEYALFYSNSKSKWEYWEKHERDAEILRKKMLAKFSITPQGDFYRDLREGNLKKVGKEAAVLKKDVDGLLSLIRAFK